jgi:hypothetical protein
MVVRNSCRRKIVVYDIWGKPYRGARRTLRLHGPFNGKKKAEAEMDRLIKAGELDPYAWLRKRPQTSLCKRKK